MDDLEARFTWWPRAGHDLIERAYFYAEGMLALKELEYLGAVRQGPIKGRIAGLRAHILERIEDRRFQRRSSEPDPVRVKELHRACLDALARPGCTAEEAAEARRDLTTCSPSSSSIATRATT